MELVGGPLGVTAIAVAAVLAITLAVLHFGFHAFRRRKGRGRGKSGVVSDSRVEVLETTIIDDERRLVLIRCDRIEHLIMIGGPVDLVVENDVRKVRGPGAPPAKIPGFETEKHVAATPRPTPGPAAHDAIAPTPKPTEPNRATPRPAAGLRAPSAASRNLPAIQPAAGRAGARSSDTHAPAAPRSDDAGRTGAARPQSADTQLGRRDAPARRTPLTPHSPAPSGRTAESARAPSSAVDRSARPGRTGGRTEPAAGLPAAQIPWSDPDSIENEIVRALRFDPRTRGSDQAAGRREPPSAKAMVDSTTTLGDLADRLEEALAREVQSANQLQHAEPEPDEFGFDSEPVASEVEPAKPSAPKDRHDKPHRSEPQRPMAPAPEPEARREAATPAERREEAPVISLNSRRRESADQLEDEMARLLGELTSDTKGR